MSAVVYECPGEVAVHFDEAAQELLVVWQRFSGNSTVFRASLDAQAELVESGRARYVIVDASRATGAPSARDQDYLARFVSPRYRAGGVRAIVTVLPREALARRGAQRWIRTGSMFRFAAYDAATLEDARELVAQHRAEDVAEATDGARPPAS